MNQAELNLTGKPCNDLKRSWVPCPNCEREKSEFVCWFCMGKLHGRYEIMFGQMSNNQQDDYLANRKIGEFRYDR